jgi:hypothetical protein
MIESVFRQREFSLEAVDALSRGGLHPLLARLYAARGVSTTDELALELKHLGRCACGKETNVGRC